MTDPDTREEVRLAVKANCPMRVMIRRGVHRGCHFFGFTGKCSDCTHDWMMVAEEVRKLVESRRSSYEKEHEKLIVIKREHKNMVSESSEQKKMIKDFATRVNSLASDALDSLLDVKTDFGKRNGRDRWKKLW